MFFEYGDDSVAQLGGVHLACEQASNLLTKVLEWGRLMSYLEQCTRYIAYDARLGGRYRYYRDRRGAASRRSAPATSATWTACSTRTAELLAGRHRLRARDAIPKEPGDTDFVYRQTIRAKALDAVRGMLPAASLSNVGIYGTGQALRGAAAAACARTRCPRPATYAELMLHELRKVIPSFLRRVDLPDRGGAWSDVPRDDPRATRPTLVEPAVRRRRRAEPRRRR